MKNQELSLSALQIIRDNHILRNVYAWMTGGLALTGIIAIGISNNNGILRSLTNNPIIFFGIIILEFILVIFLDIINRAMLPLNFFIAIPILTKL